MYPLLCHYGPLLMQYHFLDISGVNLLSGIILGTTRYKISSLDPCDSPSYIMLSSQGGNQTTGIMMVIGGAMDAVVSMLLLLIFFAYLSWYNRLRAQQFMPVIAMRVTHTPKPCTDLSQWSEMPKHTRHMVSRPLPGQLPPRIQREWTLPRSHIIIPPFSTTSQKPQFEMSRRE